MHHIYNKTNQNMALKLDMAKAFDKVNWTYLHCMLRKFIENIVQLLMKCVTTTCIAIRYNNTRTTDFKPIGGFKQGDPLFPLLFVLCLRDLAPLLIIQLKKGGEPATPSGNMGHLSGIF